MHPIHKTESIVLSHRNVKEANRVYSLYTRDFGFIRATAQSVRKGTSKLNAHLQDFSIINVDLVRGRDIWRITNANRSTPLVSINESEIKFAKRFSELLLRLCRGEEANQELFSHIRAVFELLQNSENKKQDIGSLEIVAILRTLHLLGYIPEHPIATPFLSGPISSEILSTLAPHTRELVRTINQSLKETHL